MEACINYIGGLHKDSCRKKGLMKALFFDCRLINLNTNGKGKIVQGA